ncbi:MAG: hypothetical protein HMLIMOIP_002094 [Candidatus Nitrosomirales archaeon]|jgi:hypothetical protein
MPAGRAVGYSDYYKNNDNTPDSPDFPTPQKNTDTTAEQLKKKALKRRLKIQRMKAVKRSYE